MKKLNDRFRSHETVSITLRVGKHTKTELMLVNFCD